MAYRNSRRLGRAGGRSTELMTASCIVAVLYIAIVFLISMSRAGTWVAQKVIAPVFGMDTKSVQVITTAAPAEEDKPSAQSASIPLPAAACYALQMGVYENGENAKAQAEAIRRLGAAGYIKSDGVRYRVLASGYTDPESLAKVKEQLQLQGIDSTGFTMEANACTLSVSAMESEIQAYTDALLFVTELQSELSDKAIEFDREKQTADAGTQYLGTLDNTLKEKRAALEGNLSASTSVSEALLEFYDTMMLFLEDTLSAQSLGRIDVASALKYSVLLSADLIREVYNAVETA